MNLFLFYDLHNLLYHELDLNLCIYMFWIEYLHHIFCCTLRNLTIGWNYHRLFEKKKVILGKLGYRNNSKSNMAAIVIEKEKNERYSSYLQIEHDRAICTVFTAQTKTWHWHRPLFTVNRTNCRKVALNRKYLHLHWYEGMVYGSPYKQLCWFVHKDCQQLMKV